VTVYSEAGLKHVQIISISGLPLVNETIGGNQFTVSLRKGIYIVKTKTATGKVSQSKVKM